MIGANKRIPGGATFGLCLALALTAALSGISCKMGLGDEIDLVAPTLTITSHTNLQYVGKNLTLKGTCNDNVKVERIVVENVTTKATYSNAVIGPDSWSIDLELPEGEETLRVIAYDKNSNSSIESVRQLTLLVDATDPFLKNFEIVRMPGITTQFRERSFLEGLNENDPANIDFFQNGTFTLRGAVFDNYSLSKVVLNLYDENKVLILSKPLSAGANPTTPSFTITADELVQAVPAYATGKHFISGTVSCTDIGGNDNTDPFLWFCWYPEADKARIKQGMTDDQGTLVIPKDNSILLELFDDDALSEVYAAVVATSAWAGVSGSTDSEKLTTIETNAAVRASLLGTSVLFGSTPRNWTYTLPSSGANGEFALICSVKDIKADGSAPSWSSRKITLQVTDQDSPLTVVTTPSENTVPTLTGGSVFSLEGYCLDNAGTKSLKIAWIPDGLPDGANAHVKEAETLLTNSSIMAGEKLIDASGITLWSIPLGSSQVQDLNGKKYVKNDFSFDFDIFTSFMYKGKEENSLKVFVLLASDGDKNIISQTYRLLGDKNPPSIAVTNPSTDMAVHRYDENLFLSFTASKANGLAMKSYSIVDITDALHPVEISLTASGTSRYCTIPASSLSEGRRKYQFRAVDQLDNEVVEQRTVILTSLPTLSYITSGQINGSYKTGDTVYVQAVFDRPVKVTGSPRLELWYSSTDSTPRYASYVSGSNTSTLVFSYTVPVGATSSLLYSAPTPINLNGSTIETSEGTGGTANLPGIAGVAALGSSDSLQGRKALALDGVSPTITGISVDDGDGVLRAGETITVTVKFSENIQASYYPILSMTGPKNGFAADFVKTNANTAIFSHTVADKEDTQSLSWNYSNLLSDSSSFKDLAGNSLVVGVGNGTSPTVIDTVEPAKLTINSPATNNGFYSGAQTIGCSGKETGTKAYYSAKGGLDWLEWTPGTMIAENGTHILAMYQVDEAGNESKVSDTVTVTLNNCFPSITSISCQQPDGSYGIGSVLNFRVAFDGIIMNAGSAKLTIGDAAGGPSTQAIDVLAIKDSKGTTVLDFKYTVGDGMEMRNVIVKSLNLTGAIDMFGNSPSVKEITYGTDQLNRANLFIDSIAPSLAPGSCDPVNGALNATGALKTETQELKMLPVGDQYYENVQVTLTFSEPVWAESGTIVIRPAKDWPIPAVLTQKEFEKIYASGINATQQNTIMQGIGGSAALDVNGLPIGPYKKNTHGLKLSGTTLVPDTSTKYVLHFDYNPTDTGTGVVSNIRAVLEAAGYKKQEFDVTSSAVTMHPADVMTKVVLQIAQLPIGRKWTVDISAGAFRDASGNPCPATSVDEYTFWTNKVETPVIRVKRFSEGLVYNSGGALQPSIANTAPKGKTDFRIDCETPDATIWYKKYEPAKVTVVKASHANATSTIADATTSNLSGETTVAYAKNAKISVGDGLLNTAQKIFISAYATHDDKDTPPQLPKLDKSSDGYEGAFKTLMIYWDVTDDPDSKKQRPGPFAIQGSNIQGGVPTIAGFPLKDADPVYYYSRYFYNPLNTKDYYWQSWEIVSELRAQSKYKFPAGNWQRNGTNSNYNSVFYGQFRTRTGQRWWDE